MNILYLSCHEVLEFDELCLLSELDGGAHKLFSMGAYGDPRGGRMRGIVPRMDFNQELYGVAMQCDKDNLHPELIDWCDIVLMMHNSAIPGQKEQQAWLVRNWKLLKEKNKKVVWRSIGQSTPAIEEELQGYRSEGLKIVRYSPIEEKIPHYAGSDALIRFYKDEDVLSGWVGDKKEVVTVAQSFKKRGHHLGYSFFDQVTSGFLRKVIGTENEDLEEIWSGPRSYYELIEDLRKARAFFYYGTIPAPYTLSFIEAMMIGIPVVAVGPKLRKDREPPYNWHHYEIPNIINHGVNGYYSDSIDDLRGYIKLLLEDDEKAQKISEAGRKTAIELFGKQGRMAEWSKFLSTHI